MVGVAARPLSSVLAPTMAAVMKVELPKMQGGGSAFMWKYIDSEWKCELWNRRMLNVNQGRLENFAVCIEMFIAAVGHHFAFTAAPYHDASVPRTPCCYSWWSMLDISDVKRDVVQHVRHVGTTVGFIGSASRLFQPLPRTSVVPGLARSRAFAAASLERDSSSRINAGVDIESQPLIPAEDDENASKSSRRKGTLSHHHWPPDRLAPDTPWGDDDGDDSRDEKHALREEEEADNEEDEGGFVFVRPEFISVPQELPKL